MDNKQGFRLSGRMFELGGKRVMLDHEVARLYRVEPPALLRAVRRGRSRFPPGAVFQLTREEFAALRRRGKVSQQQEDSPKLPYAFTELGVFMVSSVIKNRRAAEISVAFVREYVGKRRQASAYPELERKIQSIEASGGKDVQAIFKVLAELRKGAGEKE